MKHGTGNGYNKGCRCEVCKNAKNQAGIKYRLENKEKISKRVREWQNLNRDRVNLAARRWRVKNLASAREYMRKRRLTPEGKEVDKRAEVKRKERLAIDLLYRLKRAAYLKAWKVVYRATGHGRGTVRAANAARKRKLKLSSFDSFTKKLLKIIYQRCPEGFHVDHVTPIARGGLHLPENLCYLPASINVRKHDSETFDVSQHAVEWIDVIRLASFCFITN